MDYHQKNVKERVFVGQLVSMILIINSIKANLNKMTDPKIKHQMRELIKLFKEKGIIGKSCVIGKYYAIFNFKLRKEPCKECGHVLCS